MISNNLQKDTTASNSERLTFSRLDELFRSSICFWEKQLQNSPAGWFLFFIPGRI